MASERRKSNEHSQRKVSQDQTSETGKKSPQVVGRQLSPRISAQWKATFYENVQLRALNFQEVKIQNLQKKKMQEIKTEKKEPPDNLSQEWFNTEAMTLETRAYLLEKLLPTLVPGVEKLLKVAERKKVLEAEEDESIKFDPLNFLGEYLMRHNPAYDISAIPNPYMRGMMVVKDELKSQVPETTMHKLAQMKNLVKEKRQHREEVDDIKNQVAKMRKEALAVQFKEWTLDASESMPLALIQSALTSFLEVVTTAPPDAGAEMLKPPLLDLFWPILSATSSLFFS